MTNTVFSMFQTRYILDFLSASRSSGTLGFSKHWDFQSKDVASEAPSVRLYKRVAGTHFLVYLQPSRCLFPLRIGPLFTMFRTQSTPDFSVAENFGLQNMMYLSELK
jgi:hypothetical protein